MPSLPGPATFYCSDEHATIPGVDISSRDGSAAHPWRTPQYALDVLMDGYNLCRYPVDIVCETAPVGYAGGAYFYPDVNFSGRIAGQAGGIIMQVNVDRPPLVVGRQGMVTLRGSDPTGIGRCLIIPPVASGKSGITLTDSATLAIRDIGIHVWESGNDPSPGVKGGVPDCLDVFDGARASIGNVLFGNARDCHIAVGWDGRVIVDSGYQINGGNPVPFHVNVGADGLFFYNTNGDPQIPINVQFNGNPNFSWAYAGVQEGGVAYFFGGAQWTGTCTGKKAVIFNNGIIHTGGSRNPSLLPGDVPIDFEDGCYPPLHAQAGKLMKVPSRTINGGFYA